MSVIAVVVDLAVAALVAYFIYDGVQEFASKTGTVWERLLAAGKDSVTILWGRFVVIVSGLSGGLVVLADYLNAPGVGDTIKSVIQPQYVMALTIGIGLISEFARRRTL